MDGERGLRCDGRTVNAAGATSGRRSGDRARRRGLRAAAAGIAFTLAGLFASATVQAGLSFNVAPGYGAGATPISVAVGDFNGDGKADLAVANRVGGNVTILLGAGDGTFAAAVSYGTGTGSMSVAVGDFDGDGKADLAVANSGGNVSILLGAGDGTFAAAVNYGTGANPYSVAVGDFNGDGKADLAIVNGGDNNVSILLGAGDGTFAAAVNYGTGNNPLSVAVGDFDGDGDADLAVANYYSGNNVSILLGAGDGTFAAAVNYGTGSFPYSVAVGDFDGDGKADLAVANSGGSDVSILLGAGDGTFAAAVNYDVGSFPYSVAIDDFNGDGKPDLAVANWRGNDVSILLGAGDGTFAAAVNYGAGRYPYSVAVGDFDGDGDADLAVANYLSNDVSILLGAGDGTFAAAVNYGAGSAPHSVAVGDFDGDGNADLAVANHDSNNVSIVLGAGDGTFAAAVNYGAGSNPRSVAVGDFNGDGDADLAIVNGGDNNVSILLGAGNGTFAAAVTYGTGNNPFSVAVGDFDGDGDADLAIVNASSNNVSILLGAGDGTFAAAVNYGAGSASISVAVGDFNGDGKADLAVANSGGNNVSILLGAGDGTFAAAVNYGTGANPYSVAVGDFNGDGKADLAVANSGGNNVSILLGAGDGTFAAAVNYGTGSDPRSVAVGDFDGDGDADLAIVNGSSNNVSILLGAGDGTFAAAVNYGTGSHPRSVAVGDFDGDGDSDLAIVYSSSNVSILLGAGDGTFAAAVNYGAGANPYSVTVGDFNGDGKADLAVANSGGNNLSILLNTSNSPLSSNADLAGLTLSSGALSPAFTAATTSYTAGVANGTATITVTPTVAQPGAAVTVNGTPVASGTSSGAIALAVGANPIGIVVTAPDTVTTRTYTVTVTRAAATYAVAYDANGATGGSVPVDGNAYATGQTVTVLGNTGALVRIGHTFAGWNSAADGGGAGYTGGATFAMGAAAVTLYAQWQVDSYTVTFDSNGGSAIASQSVPYGGTATVPANPTRTGYSFLGWYSDAGLTSPYSFATPVTSALTVYASWQLLDMDGDGVPDLWDNCPMHANSAQQDVDADGIGDACDTISVTYNANGATGGAIPVDGNAYGPGTTVTVLGNSGGLVKAGYAFAGWNTAADGSGTLHGPGATFKAGTGSVTLYAHWTTPLFAAAGNYGVGSYPRSVAVGDFNGDGKVDLAVAKQVTSNVAILLGAGDGTFGTEASYGAGSRPYSVAVGDFDGDGKADLAVANNIGDSVSILLGAGDGTFAAAANYGAGDRPASVAVGDFDGDGKADLAVANYFSNDVSILLGAGDGTFAAAVSFAAGSGAWSVAVGDFNGDGKVDLAVANSGGNDVSILLGAGDGTFAAAVNHGAGVSPGSVAVGDFNGDGKADLAVANVSGNNVSILLGAGDGTFAAAVNFGAGGSPFSIAVGDFDRDGKADLAVANYYGNNMSILLGAGDGTFAAPVSYGAGTGPWSIAMADFNGDGKADLATANGNVTNVSIFLNVSVQPANANLAALSLSAGTLTPAFAGATTSYAASVAASTTSITVTPTVAESGATVTVNGTPVASGTSSGAIALAVGANPIGIVVTAPDTVTTRTYTVTVTRNASAVSTLAGLAASAGAIAPAFASGMFAYTLSVPNATASTTVTATATDGGATITVDGVATASGSASGPIALAVGLNTIAVVVTAQDGVTTTSYTIGVTRAASSVATLAALSISAGVLSAPSEGGPFDYTAFVSNSASSTTVTATATDANATITVDGTPTASGAASPPIPLAIGLNTITVVVTAQDGVTTRSYTIGVTRGSVATSTTLGSSANPSTPGQTVTLTATVTPSSATGTVTFYDGASSLGSASLAEGTASFGVSSLGIGTHTITAAYGGDSVRAGSTSNAVSQVVVLVTTTTTLASSQNPVGVGLPVTFTATVAPSTATGSVAFSADGVPICSGVALAAGEAQCTTSSLAGGGHSIVAAYGGDGTHASGNATLVQSVSSYVFTFLDYPGGGQTDVRGINSVGQVAGYTVVGSDEFSFVYSGGTFAALAPVPSGQGVAYANAIGINDAGTVVGATVDDPLAWMASQGFIYSGGTYTFHAKPGWDWTEFRAVGPDGRITGLATTAPGGAAASVGFIYDPATSGYTDIVIPSPIGWRVIPQGINAAGQVVGSVDDGAGNAESFLREPDGTVTKFTVHGLPARARGINDTGLITGWIPDGGVMKGFVGNSSGYQILAIPGAQATVPQSINNQGQVAGLWIDGDGNYHGFVASPATLPTGTTVGGAYTFSAAVIPDVPIFLDPLVAHAYDYATGAGDPTFATVRLPIGVGDSQYTIVVPGACGVGGTPGTGASFDLAGGVLFDFRTHGCPAGVAGFRVAGIEPSAFVDPTDPEAFVTEVTFTAAGTFTGTQGPVTVFTPWLSSTVLSSSADPTTYGATVTLTATVTSNGPTPTGTVTFSEGPTTLCAGVALDGAGKATCPVAALGAGSHSLTAAYAGTPDHAGSAGNLTQVVDAAAQAIGFPAPAPVAFVSGGTFVVGATGGGSTSPLVFTSLSTGVCTVSSTTATSATIAMVKAGVCTIAANQAADANYLAAPQVTIDVTINAAAATATLGGLAAVWDGTPKSATCSTTPPGLSTSLDYSDVGFGTARIGAGSYGVLCTITDPSYTGSASGTLVIAQAGQSITFEALADRSFGEPDFAVAATASSGLPVALESLTAPVCTLIGGGPYSVHLVATGACTIRATQGGDANREAAVPVDRTFNVVAGGATAVLGDLGATYDGTPKSATCTTSPIGLSTAIAYSDVGSGTGRTNAGSYGVQCTITAPGYVGSADGALVIAKASSSTTVASSANPSAPGASVTFTATVTGIGPTGTVAFADGGAPIAGCESVALAGGGNAPTAQCATSALASGSHGIVATFGGDANHQGSTSASLAQTVDEPASVNVALAANGGVASASSTYTAAGQDYRVGSINDNERAGANWTHGGGWMDATRSTFPDWVQIAFAGSKTIDKVVVYTVQDNLSSPVEPTDALRFTQWGITAFAVQTWNNGGWVTRATVNRNALVKRTITFPAITTDRVRVVVTDALARYSRITEVEAWTASGRTPTTTTLSSSPNPSAAGQSVTFIATVAGTGPTGTASFSDGAVVLCANVPLVAGGAQCATSALAVGSHAIVASYSGDAGNLASASAPLAQNVVSGTPSINVALASNGGVASASSTNRARRQDWKVAAINNNERKGMVWGAGGVWSDDTRNRYPDWVQIAFAGVKTIDRVVVYSPQDNYAAPVEPTDALTFTRYGVTAFRVRTWDGSRWVTQATITGNDLVKRTVSFPAVSTSRIQIEIIASQDGNSRLTEVEAWTVPVAGVAAAGEIVEAVELSGSGAPGPEAAKISTETPIPALDPAWLAMLAAMLVVLGARRLPRARAGGARPER